MSIEIITQKQCKAVMIAFLLGSAMVLGVGDEAKNDAWIAILAAMAFALPALAVYARILSLFPGKGLYDILFILFGKVVGILMTLPFVWFSFHLGALVIRNFTEFIMIVTLPETPQYVIAIFMTLLCIWTVKAGVEVLGRWTAIMLPVMIIAIFIVTLLLIPNLEMKNIKPVMGKGVSPVLDAAFSVFAFPFAEMVLFMTICGNIKNKKRPYNAYFWSLLIGGAIILLVSVRSLLTLGTPNISIMNFSSYASVRLINIGEFLQRIEVSVAIVFLLGGFVKVCVCLYAASSGLARVLHHDNYRQIVAPVGLLMMFLSLIIYTETAEMFKWAIDVYQYYAMPFEIIFPVIFWIAAEIKVHKKKQKAAA